MVHKSQLDPLFPSFDNREFWERADQRNAETGRILRQLKYTEDERAEVFKIFKYDEFINQAA